MPIDRRAINRANAERGVQQQFWAVPDRSATLTELWNRGDFAQDIAVAIGEGCTKNMVIRRAKVLGLAARSPGAFARRSLLIRVSRETKEGRAA